jgi:hypothetical protein
LRLKASQSNSGQAVGAAEHGHVGELVGHFAQLEHDAIQPRQDHLVAA